MAKVHKNKHESNINNSDEDDNEENKDQGYRVPFYMEGHIDEIADSAEFGHNVEQLMDMVEVIELGAGCQHYNCYVTGSKR